MLKGRKQKQLTPTSVVVPLFEVGELDYQGKVEVLGRNFTQGQAEDKLALLRSLPDAHLHRYLKRPQSHDA